jgi:hypothetical protein
LQARIEDELLEQLRKRTKAEHKLVGEAIDAVIASWGQPYQHSGIGIRRLTKTIYECRLGLDERLAFLVFATPPELVFFFLGNHDEIKKLIQSAQ